MMCNRLEFCVQKKDVGEKKIKIALMLKPHEAGAQPTSCQPTANFLFKALAELIEGLIDVISLLCQTSHLHSDIIHQAIVLKYFFDGGCNVKNALNRL